jgi:hypothetical protein
VSAGPLELLDPASLQPFPITPSFEGLVADRLSGIAGADVVLAGAATHAGANPPDDLEGAYASTIAPAADAANNETETTVPSTIPDRIAAGDAADDRRVDAQKYLPDVGAPIEQDFKDPPAAPGDIGEPGGVENPPPPQV